MTPHDAPEIGATPVESVIAAHTVRRALWAGPLVMAGAWILCGRDR